LPIENADRRLSIGRSINNQPSQSAIRNLNPQSAIAKSAVINRQSAIDLILYG
jgi:hypothetical protein